MESQWKENIRLLRKSSCTRVHTRREVISRAWRIYITIWLPRSVWWTSLFIPPHPIPGAFFGPGPMPVYMDPALIHTIEQGDAVARTLGKGDAVMLRGHGSMVVGQTIEWVFAACVDLEEAAVRFYQASLLGPVRVYSDDETQRVMKGRRKDSVVQKIWDHNVAKTKLARLMEGI